MLKPLSDAPSSFFTCLLLGTTVLLNGCSGQIATPDACVSAALTAQELVIKSRVYSTKQLSPEEKNRYYQMLVEADSLDKAYQSNQWKKINLSPLTEETLTAYCRNRELSFQMTINQLESVQQKTTKKSKKKRSQSKK